MRSGNRFFTTFGLCLLVASPAYASLTQGSSGIASPSQFYDFGVSLYPDGTPITTQFAGITFTGVNYFDFGTTFPNITDGSLDPFPTSTTGSILFSSPPSAVSFSFVSNPGATTFVLSNGGTTVETDIVATNFTNTANYFTFSGITFDTIAITAPGNNAFGLDNLAIGTAATPEPGTYALLASFGLTGAAFLRRRKAYKAA